MSILDQHLHKESQDTEPPEGLLDSMTTKDESNATGAYGSEGGSLATDDSASLPNDFSKEQTGDELEYGQPTEEAPSLTPNEKTIDEAASEEVNQTKASETLEVGEELAKDGFTGIANIPETTVYLELREKHDAGEKLTDKDVDKIADIAVNYLRQILHCFGEDDTVIDEFEGDDGELILEITGGDLAVLIGKHGNTLSALQQTLNTYIAKHIGFRYSLFVDIDGYRAKRKETVASIAKKAAKRATESQRDAELKPMNAYERRLVHIALKDNECVETFSCGEDPYRYVVVHPKESVQEESAQAGQTEPTDTDMLD